MYIDYFACPYDQVLPMSNAQAQGMGDYLSPFAFTTPQYLSAGGRGLGCADCGCSGCNGGMGALTFDGTGLWGSGLFSGDMSTWGAGEYGVLALGAFVLYSVVFTSRRTGEAVRSKVSRVSARARKIRKGFS
jgi:hypothetical protein